MTHSTTNTAARELLASALDECGRPTDAAEVREGRNPFVRGEYALAAIEKSLAQQQGGEQEAVAWGQFEDGRLVGLAFQRNEAGECTTPLYTTPPRHPADGGMAMQWPRGVLNRDKTLELLISHNEWRRGKEGPQTDPRLLGLALEAAIAALQAGTPSPGAAGGGGK